VVAVGKVSGSLSLGPLLGLGDRLEARRATLRPPRRNQTGAADVG
jgi:hypothetical protein